MKKDIIIEENIGRNDKCVSPLRELLCPFTHEAQQLNFPHQLNRLKSNRISLDLMLINDVFFATPNSLHT